MHLSICVCVTESLCALVLKIYNSSAINILIPYNYIGSHTHALSLSGGIHIHFLVITSSIKQTNWERTSKVKMREEERRGMERWGRARESPRLNLREGKSECGSKRESLNEWSRRRGDGESRCSVSMRTVTSFLLCARSHSYFVSKCSSLHRCFLHSLFHFSILLSLLLWLALHLCLSNIILHLASLSAQHHLNSYHYNQHPNCPRSLQNNPLLASSSSCPPSLFAHLLILSITCMPSLPSSPSPPYFTPLCLRGNKN